MPDPRSQPEDSKEDTRGSDLDSDDIIHLEKQPHASPAARALQKLYKILDRLHYSA